MWSPCLPMEITHELIFQLQSRLRVILVQYKWWLSLALRLWIKLLTTWEEFNGMVPVLQYCIFEISVASFAKISSGVVLRHFKKLWCTPDCWDGGWFHVYHTTIAMGYYEIKSLYPTWTRIQMYFFWLPSASNSTIHSWTPKVTTCKHIQKLKCIHNWYKIWKI